MSFFLKTEVPTPKAVEKSGIEGPSFASSRPDRSQRRGSENAGAPVSRTSRRSRQAPQAVSLRMILSVSFEARRLTGGCRKRFSCAEGLIIG